MHICSKICQSKFCSVLLVYMSSLHLVVYYIMTITLNSQTLSSCICTCFKTDTVEIDKPITTS